MKNWPVILFLSFLAIVMIGSSHSADKKVHQISQLNAEVKELHSEFVDTRLEARRLKMETVVTKQVAQQGLGPSLTPPKKIKVTKTP